MASPSINTGIHVSSSSVNSPQPRCAAVLIFYEWRKKPTSFSSKKKKQLWEYAESKRWKSALKSAKVKALSCQIPTLNSIDRYSSISPSASVATHLSSSSTATTSPESQLTSTSPESQSTSLASQQQNCVDIVVEMVTFPAVSTEWYS